VSLIVCLWRKLVRERDICEEERIVEADNLGEFYRFINKRISNKSSIGAIVGDCGEVLTENMDKANAFNKYFASVGVVDDGVNPYLTQETTLVQRRVPIGMC